MIIWVMKIFFVRFFCTCPNYLHFAFIIEGYFFAEYVISGWKERARKKRKLTEKNGTNRKQSNVEDLQLNRSAIILKASTFNTRIESQTLPHCIKINKIQSYAADRRKMSSIKIQKQGQ